MSDKKLCVRFSPEVTKPAEMDQDLVRLVRWLKKKNYDRETIAASNNTNVFHTPFPLCISNN